MHDTSNDFLPSSVLQCTDIRIVRVVVLLRVVVLAFVPHGWTSQCELQDALPLAR